MIFFISGSEIIDLRSQYSIGNLAMTIIVAIFILNVVVLSYLNIKRFNQWLRIRKARKRKVILRLSKKDSQIVNLNPNAIKIKNKKSKKKIDLSVIPEENLNNTSLIKP